jgi:hypothetical protein
VIEAGRRRSRPACHGDDLPAMHAGAGADVEDVIGLADRLLVMLDHDHRVALVAQVLQRVSSRSLSRWCSPMEGSSST